MARTASAVLESPHLVQPRSLNVPARRGRNGTAGLSQPTGRLGNIWCEVLVTVLVPSNEALSGA